MDECIDAAGREWEPYWQRRLLDVSPFLPRSFLQTEFTVGCKIRPRILGFIQSYGLRQHGTNSESFERNQVLRNWYSPYAVAVCLSYLP